jgi:hypothetical protein
MKKQFLLNSITFLYCIFGTIDTLNAQIPKPVSFNTAVNAGLNGTIPLLSNDLSWTSSSVSISGPYVPAVRASNLQSAWLVSPYPTANWITYPHTCLPNNPTDHSCNGVVNEYFRLMFNLPAVACNNSVSLPGGYCLTMNYFADNCVYEIFVNGLSAFSNPTCSTLSNGFSAATGKTVTICDNWQPGTNTLVVNIKSGMPTAGFLAFVTATASTPGSFSVTTTQTNVSCFAAGNASASVSLPGYSGPASYTWLPSGGNGSIATNLSPGIYTINVQVPLCSGTNTLSITQPASFAVNVSTTQAICKGTKITFTASGAETYSWSPGNQSGPIVTYTPFGTTVYTVTGNDAMGCKVSKSFTLQVATCAEIAESRLSTVQIRNSSSGNLIIESGDEREFRTEIHDLKGQLKYWGILRMRSEIDVSELSPGIYVLMVSRDDSFLRKRIIVSR